MDVDERPVSVVRERVRAGAVRFRRHLTRTDDVPDESVFFLLALLAGAISGYVVAIG